MIALAYLAGLALYGYVVFRAMRFAWRKGRARGSRSRAVLYGAIAFLVFYLPFFWEDVPTLVVHHRLCERDGGLKVHTSPERWMSAHQSMLDSLRVVRGGEAARAALPHGWQRDYLLNKHVALEYKYEPASSSLQIQRRASRLVDVAENAVLIEYVEYISGSPFGGLSSFKFWIARAGCDRQDTRSFETLRNAFLLTER